MRPAQKCLNSQDKLIQIDGLYHIIIDAKLIAAAHEFHIVISSHEKNRNVRINLAQIFGEIKAGSSRKHDVGDHQVTAPALHDKEGVVGSGAAGDAIAPRFQMPAYGII